MTQGQVRADFDRDGYVALRPLFGAAKMAEINRELDRYIADVVPGMAREEVYYERKDDPSTLKQMQRMAEYDPYFRSLAESGEIRDLARACLGEEVRMVNVEYFNKPAGIGQPTPPHQDGYYFHLSPCSAVTGWLALEDVDELAVLAAGLVDALEVQEGREEEAVHLERTLEVRQGLFGLVHLRLEELAELGENLFLMPIRRGDLEGLRKGLAVALAVAALTIELRHLSEGSDVVGIELYDLRVHRLRVVGTIEVVAVPLGEEKAEPDLPLRIRLALEPTVDGVENLGPAPRVLSHHIEMLRRLLVEDVDLEGLHESIECLVLVAELLFEDLGDFPEQLRLLGGFTPSLETAKIEFDERLEACRVGVQTLEDREGFVVRRIDFEDPLPSGGGAIGVTEGLDPKSSGCTVLFDLRRSFGECSSALHLDIDDLFPLLVGAIDRV